MRPITSPPAVFDRGDHTGLLDFYPKPAVMRNPSTLHWRGVRGSLVESQDFYHLPVITRPPPRVSTETELGVCTSTLPWQ